MKLTSLSASSAKVYETCPARWKVEYEDKSPRTGGSAANLGTVCHEALERWVAEGHYQAGYTPDQAIETITRLYDEAWWRLFSDRKRYREGLDLTLKWLDRQDWTGRIVLSTEEKFEFMIPTSIGDVPLRYIWDRCDQLDDDGFEIEVVDYKTVMAAVSPEDLRNDLIQPAVYALAAMLKYPKAKKVRVTFDLLRYDRVGVIFTREECHGTWDYLHGLAERIIADDGTTETLNDECRWCPRKAACVTLARSVELTKDVRAMTPEELAEMRVRVGAAVSALKNLQDDVDTQISTYMKGVGAQEHELENGYTLVEYRTGSRRFMTVEDFVAIFGEKKALEVASIPIKVVDELLEDPMFSPADLSVIRRRIRRTQGSTSVKVKPPRKR